MPVCSAHRIRRRRPHGLRSEQIGALEVLARAGIPHGQIGDNALRIDEPLGNRRLQCQRGSRHVAPWTGDALGSGEFVALANILAVGTDSKNELRHAIGPMLVEISPIIVVPRLLPLKSMVRTQIDHHRVIVKLRRQGS